MSDLDLTPGQPKGSETILSEEMWEKILMHLRDPSDVLNAAKMCVQFQRILQTKTTEAYLAKTLPILMDYMDGNSVLNCRKVSKGWMGVVDNFFENIFLGKTIREPSIFNVLRASFPITIHRASLYPFGGENSDHERFIREMKNHPRNPFIGRSVYFELTTDQDFRTVYNFFEIFGKHIWTLEINTLEVEREDILPFIIRDLYELAPNLKSLRIRSALSPTVSMSNHQIRALAPPPALEKLEISHAFDYNDIDVYDADCTEVENAILLRHSNSQLNVLHIKTLDALQNLNWPNLRELHFMDTNGEGLEEVDVIFLNLRLPNLELLSIGMGEDVYVRNFKYWEEKQQTGRYKAFVKFFQALYHLGTSSPNLKTVRFTTTWLWDKDLYQPVGFPKGQPCPENIKTLKIPEEKIFFRKRHGTSDYSFLLQFPHVENIHVSRSDNPHSVYKRGGAAFDSEIVEVHKFMYSGRMYESNIWKLLPSLNVFSYGERVYKRSSYERRLAK